MSRAIKSSQLSLKLDVILEEEINTSNCNLGIVGEALQQAQLSPYNTTCTITLRKNSDVGNEPQFLHTGKWPTVDDMDNEPRSSSRLSPTTNEGYTSTATISPDQDISSSHSLLHNKDDLDTDTWMPITADELSMAMDFWNPNTSNYRIPPHSIPQTDTSPPTMTSVQESLFHREIENECLTRTQTVAHIEELEDNDSAVEVVATLEGYRQNGWAGETLAAFPRQCWDFWVRSGLAGGTSRLWHELGHGDDDGYGVCNGYSFVGVGGGGGGDNIQV